jgi:hypothetical protein
MLGPYTGGDLSAASVSGWIVEVASPAQGGPPGAELAELDAEEPSEQSATRDQRSRSDRTRALSCQANSDLKVRVSNKPCTPIITHGKSKRMDIFRLRSMPARFPARC